MTHELAGLFVNTFRINQDLSDLLVKVVTNRAYYQTAFLVYQESAALTFGGVFNRAPKLEQIVQIPLQLFFATADASSPSDNTHAWGDIQFRHYIAQFSTVFSLYSPGYPSTPGVVRHKDEITAGEGDIGGKSRPLRTTLILVHLNNKLLALMKRILNAGSRGVRGFLEVRAGYFLERKKAMPFTAILDKRSFEARLKTGDDSLVDITLALFLGSRLDVKIDQLLPIDNSDTKLFRLCRVKQHAFHNMPPALWSRVDSLRARKNMSSRA
jgi:hypothetical protein